MNTSSVATLRQQVTSEHEAAQAGLSGLALVASHHMITACMERAWWQVQTLRATGEPQEALALLTSDALYEADDEAENPTRKEPQP